MAQLLMPKATAVWLVENTALSFEQIADFCGLHSLEIQAIADEEVSIGMRGLDPLGNGQITMEEIERCQADPKARLVMSISKIPEVNKRPKGARYTPVSKRQDRPNAIAWLVKNYPEVTDSQIGKLLGTTKPTITAVRDKSHWNSANHKPQNPAQIGLCSVADLEKVIAIARAKAGTTHAPRPIEFETSESEPMNALVEASIDAAFKKEGGN
ncbi:MAG: DUF1013 domain-containing protein [Alphaproteobacteria bacterium]|nr:DUF1013 domain-containing protein [Rhodospirillales bacterium]MCW9046393.1 DUF1013 domain-containing protein [Alphaproteobacteria bacterium]